MGVCPFIGEQDLPDEPIDTGFAPKGRDYTRNSGTHVEDTFARRYPDGPGTS